MKKYNRLTTYFKENWYIVLPMCVTALLFNSLMCMIPQIEGKTIDSIKSGDFLVVRTMVLWFLCLVLFVQLNRFCKRYLVRVFGNKMSLRMKEVSFKHLLKKDMTYFASHEIGDIMNRNSSDIYDSTEGIRKMTTEVFDTIVLLVGYFVSMFFLDYKITLYCLIFIFLSIISAQFMKRMVYKTNRSYKEYLSIHKEKTISMLSNELYYRGFGVGQRYRKDYEDSLDQLRRKNKRALLFQSSLEPIYSILAWIGCFFVVYFGGKNVMAEVYEIGTFSAILTTYLLISKKAAKVGKVFNAYQAFKVSWVRCKDFLVQEQETKVEIIYDGEDLVLKDFSFQYETGFQIPHISVSVHTGQRVGICGRVHTGKSTILKGLSGIYSYEGKATLCGNEIADIQKSGKSLISYSSNQIKLFSDTIKNNIVLGRKGNFIQAITCSKLDTDLETLGGVDAILSHSVSNISGGQQKRLQMARAIYPETKLVLLDDPFQSVHPKMAEEMISNLKMGQRIVVLVSNQKNILSKLEKIIYLEDNRAHIGNYQELLTITGFKELMEEIV